MYIYIYMYIYTCTHIPLPKNCRFTFCCSYFGVEAVQAWFSPRRLRSQRLRRLRTAPAGQRVSSRLPGAPLLLSPAWWGQAPESGIRMALCFVNECLCIYIYNVYIYIYIIHDFIKCIFQTIVGKVLETFSLPKMNIDPQMCTFIL